MMGMEQRIEVAEKLLERGAREATEHQDAEDFHEARFRSKPNATFAKPFRPAPRMDVEARLAKIRSAIQNKTAVEWIIVGWQHRGAVPHFGAPKVGKTTGVNEIVAHIVSIDTPTGKRKGDYHGAVIAAYGQWLWYSGEETEDMVFDRFRKEFVRYGYTGEDLERVMLRVHVICPQSMAKHEFPALNPFIMSRLPLPVEGYAGMALQANATMDWIFDYIDEHNNDVAARGGGEDDRIIGWTADSLTSVTGMGTMDDEGIPNLLSHLNRESSLRRIGCILIGHSPQTTDVDPLKPWEGAIYRIKGSVAWSALVRMMVEWRTPAGKAKLKGPLKTDWHEAKTLFDNGIVSIDDKLVVAMVADGNIAFSNKKLWFKKDGSGGFVDLSEHMIGEGREYGAYQYEHIKKQSEMEAAAAVSKSTTEVDRKPAHELMMVMLEQAMKDSEAIAKEKDDAQAAPVTGQNLTTMFKKWKKDKAAIEQFSVLKLGPRDGGISEHTGGYHSVRGWLERLAASGKIAKVVGGYVPMDRRDKGYRLKNADPVEDTPVCSTPVEIDLQSISDAILAVVTKLAEEFDAADGDKDHEVPVNAKNIQSALLASRIQDEHPVLREAYADKRLIFNGPANRSPMMQSADWYCEELTKPGNGSLERLRDGTYAIPVEEGNDA